MITRKMRELDDTKRHIRARFDFGANRAAGKQLVVLALAFPLALLMLVMITKPAYTKETAQRLPDLRMGSLQDLKIRKSPDGRRLLRFSTLLVNVGAGPFELYGQRPDTATPTMSVSQRIFDSAGNHRDISTSAVMFFSGDGHDHWHVKGFQRYTLRHLSGSGEVREGAKQGFCVYDGFAYNLTLPGAPETKDYREPTSCGEADNESALQAQMGLSVGWSDKYGYVLPFQWIDITGLPSGTYRLKAVADAGRRFRERNEANNYTWQKIELKGNKVRMLRQGPVARYCGRGRWC